MGSLNITSYFGRVAGNVVVYTNSMISELSIFNNSDYHLIINDLSLLSNSEVVSGNYNIHCSVNELHMEDTTEITETPKVFIRSSKGRDITFNGRISGYSAGLTIETTGNIFTTSNDEIEVNNIDITAGKVGAAGNRFLLYPFVTEYLSGQLAYPQVKINASGDIYVALHLRRFMDESEVDISNLPIVDGGRIVSLVTNGTVDLYLSSAGILVGVTTESDSIPLYEADGIYYIDEISSKNVLISTADNADVNTILVIDGTITGTDSITISAFDGDDITVKGTISTSGAALKIYLGGSMVFAGNGQIVGSILNTDVIIKAGSIGTNKSSESRFDISGKSIDITTLHGVGSPANPIAVSTGLGGLRMKAEDVYLVSYLEPLYIITIESDGDVFLESEKEVLDVTEQSDVNVSAGNLKLVVSDGSIGQSDRMLIINITGQIDVTASGNIYLNQVSSDAFITDISSKNASVVFISDKDMVLINVSANDTVRLESVTGSILNGGDNEFVIKGGAIILHAGNMIGAQSKPLGIYSENGTLIAISYKGIYIYHTGGDVTVDHIESKDGPIELSTTGNAYISSMVAEADVKVWAVGSIIVIYSESKTDRVELTAIGDINIGTVRAKINVIVISTQGVYGIGEDTTINIDSENIQLTAGTFIGSESRPLVLHLSDGVLRVDGIDDIFIVNKGTDEITVDRIYSLSGDIFFETKGKVKIISVIGRDVEIISQGDISLETIVAYDRLFINAKSGSGIFGLNIPEGLSHIHADELELMAGGSIGSKDAYLVVELNETRTIIATAGYDIFIKDISSANMTIESMISNFGGVYLTSNTDTYVKEINAAEDIVLNINNGYLQIKKLISTYGGINAVSDAHMLIEYVSASKDICLTVNDGDLEIEDIIRSSYGSIDINANNGDLRLGNIEAGQKVNVTLLDVSIIGHEVDGSSIIGEEIVLKVNGFVGMPDRYIQTRTSSLSAEAYGGIYIRDLDGDLYLRSLTSETGDIYIESIGAIYVDKVEYHEVSLLTQTGEYMKIIRYSYKH